MQGEQTTQGFRLSPQQRHLWPLLGEELGSYVARCLVAVEGPATTAELTAALTRVVAAEEILRTGFRRLSGVRLPLQVISPRVAADVSTIDLSALPPKERATAFAQWARQIACESRSLSADGAGGLLRCLIGRISEPGAERHLVQLVLPALCADEVGMECLVGRLAAALAGGATGSEDEALQYVDVSEWQNDLLDGEDEDAAVGLEFWRTGRLPRPCARLLAGEDRNPPDEPFTVETLPLSIDRGLASALEAVAERLGADLEALLLAAWRALLWRHGVEGPHAVIGVTFDGRSYDEVADMVGLLARRLPIVLESDGGTAFPVLVEAAARAIPAAAPWQSLFPWDEVPHDEGELFWPYAFSYRDSAEGFSAGRSSISVLEVESEFDRFVVEAAFRRKEARLEGRLRYDPNRLPAAEAAALRDRFEVLLGGLVADTEAASGPVGRLPLLGAAEADRVAALARGAESDDAAGGPPVHRAFFALAERQPDEPAVLIGERSVSYGEVAAGARSLAFRLRRRGIGHGDVVALVAERSPETIIGILGVLESGAAYLPVDPAYPAERNRLAIEDSAACILVASSPDAAGVPEHGLPRLDVLSSGAGAEGAWGDPNPAPEPGELAYVIYTSGSTGRPKGVAVPHGALAHSTRVRSEVYGERPRRFLLLPSFSFDSSVAGTFWTLVTGGALVLVPEEEKADAGRVAGRIDEAGVSHLLALPSLWSEIVLELARREGGALDRLSTAIVAGESCTPELVGRHFELAPEVELYDEYGPTEGTVWATVERCRPIPVGEPVSIGRPIPNARAFVTEPSSAPAPHGIAGELLIGGPGLARGYLGRPGATAERFVPDPLSGGDGERLYRTGDLARFRRDGRLDFLGRIDHQVKIRGLRVELGEIECLLASRPEVREAVVVARGETPETIALAAYVTPASGDRPEPAVLREILGERLPDHMVPRDFVVLDALPRTPGGKVDRKALPEPDVESAAEEYVAPRDPIEEVLAGVWADVLGLERVGVRDDFFRLGGHSLMATRVVSRIRRAFDVEISLPELFAAPNPEAMARRVSEVLGEAGDLPEIPLVPIARNGDLPLSFAQRRLWILAQLDPADTAYVVSSAVRLRGPLDPDALERALRSIVVRHETLRSRFEDGEDGPRVVIDPEPTFPFERSDLSALPEDEREVRAREAAEREAATPFDLAAGPLLRVRLLRLDDRDHVLLVTNHHAVSDLWSLGIFIGELAAFYRAELGGDEPGLPELPVQYVDYADWQRRWFDAEVAERQLDYWRRRLADAPAALALPTDRPRGAIGGHPGASVPFRWPAETADALRRLARSEGATLFMALVALFQALLSRYSGQDDLSVGTPVAGRRRVEVEPLIGFFVNTLVLRTDLSGDPTARELLGRVRRSSLEAFAHQDVPFERLVEEVAPRRDLVRSPLFQALFVFQNAPLGELALQGLELEPFEIEPATAPYEVNLWMREAGDALIGSFQYASDLLDHETARRMVGHLERLAVAVAGSPDSRLSALSMLGEDERRTLLEDWSGRGRPARLSPVATVHDLFFGRAAERPDAIAVEHGADQVSYRELARRARSVAVRLGAAGVGPGGTVGVLAHRRLELVVALLGVLEAGAAYVPIDPAYPDERVRFLVDDSGVSVVLAGPGLAERVSGSGMQVLPLEEPPLSDTAFAAPATGARDLALVIYTSGSTGVPKGVAIEHRGIAALLGWAESRFQASEVEAVLAATSVCFDLSVFEIFVPLTRGGRVVLADDALALPELAGRDRVTLINTVPSALAQLLDLDGLPPSVHTVNLAGEPLERALVDRVREETSAERVLDLYGPTEDTTYSTVAEISLHDTEPPTIGAPIDGTRLYLLGPGLAPVPPGALGEIHLAGAGLARGYLGRPALSAERFLPDPFSPISGGRLYRTGDLGRHLSDGRVAFHGRLDHQVKLRGYRIELGEVEAAVVAHATVAEAAAQVRTLDAGALLVCWLAPVRGESLDLPGLRHHLRGSLPSWMVPARFIEVEALPRTPNGKIDRRALPTPRADDLDGVQLKVAPSTPTERALARIWEEVLGVGAIGVHDDFFDLGGHSLLATQVVSRVRRRMGVGLPLRELFESPTVAGLATAVDRLSERQASNQQVAAALEELELLSDDEVRTLLEAGGAQEA